MKYIIFKGNGFYHPVLFSDHTTHAQIKIEGCVPISAGFVKFGKYDNITVYGGSESLKLSNAGTDDEVILRRWRLDCGSSNFLTYDF